MGMGVLLHVLDTLPKTLFIGVGTRHGLADLEGLGGPMESE
jgi:hypothetical protein